MDKVEQRQLALSDSVWARVVQIVQEAMITGIDCVDLLREMRVCHCTDDDNVLVLTDAYVEHVKRSHEQLLKEAEVLKAQKRASLIIDPKS